jgi:type II secretory pathway component PulJ
VIRRQVRDESGDTLIEVLIAALLGVLVMVLVSTLMFNTQTYVNRQVAVSQLLASVSASMNTVVSSLENAQPLGYCPSSQGGEYSTPYNQCAHVSEQGASLWAAAPTGACWFAYLSAGSQVITNPDLENQAPNLQCMYAVPYTSTTVTAANNQYNLWVVSWPAVNSTGSPSYTVCQPTSTNEQGCWEQSGLYPGEVPTSPPDCTGPVSNTGGSPDCPPNQQLVARVYIPSGGSLLSFFDTNGQPVTPEPYTSSSSQSGTPSNTTVQSCLSQLQSSSTVSAWSCVPSLGQITEVQIDLHLRAAAVTGNYGTAQTRSTTPQTAQPVLGTVDQQLQLEATLFGQSYLQQQSAVVS